MAACCNSTPSTMSYAKPVKKLKDRGDFESNFKVNSKTLKKILDFIKEVDFDDAEKYLPVTKDEKLFEMATCSDIITRLVAVQDLFKLLDKLIDETPAEANKNQRFGNPTYRVWQKKMQEQAAHYIYNNMVNPENEKFGDSYLEIAEYFTASFGDETRIDYGTGHECSFICFLYCLEFVGFFTREERSIAVYHLFKSYMTICRKLQRVYVLEPAGSHGVWGLDDFHHVPLIFGAYQLKKSNRIRIPKDAAREAEKLADVNATGGEEGCGNFLIAAIRNVMDTKKGAPFFETSPQLSGILEQCPNWEKMWGGLIRMYEAEVLGKFPVIQHFLFGKILPYE